VSEPPSETAPHDLAAGEAEVRHSIRSRSIRGSLITMLAYGGTQAIRFGSNLILTRLLFEEAFGVMAVISSLIIGLHLFSDIGVGPSIIHNKRGDDPAFLNTAWTMQVIRGFVLGLIAVALAYPAAEFYAGPEQPYILPYLMVSALIAPIDGFTSTSIFTLNRHLAMVRYTLIEVGLQLVTVLVTIAWALVWPSIWALVGGYLAGGLFRTVLTHFLNPFRNRLCWDRAAARELFHFGRWIFLSTLLVFLADHAQPLIFKVLVSFDELGIYNLAAQLALLAPMVIHRITSQIFFPAFSRLLGDGLDFRGSFVAWRRILYVLGGYLVAGMIATGPPVIGVLYDPRWENAGWMLQLVAVGAWFSILQAPAESALLAMGHPKWMAAANLAKVLGIAVLVPLGFHWLAFPGAILGMGLANGVKYATTAFAARCHDLPILRHDLLFSIHVVASGMLSWWLCASLREFGFANPVVGALGVVAVTLAWAPVAVAIWIHRRRLRALLMAQAMS
jgi:O-antigen/teichoic acid export membrane protein